MVTIRGLGRGKGFEIVEKKSILDDNEVTQLIGKRMLSVLDLLVRHDLLSRDEVSATIGILAHDYSLEQQLRQQITRLKSQVDELTQERETWRSKYDQLSRQLRGYSQQIRRLQNDLEALEEVKKDRNQSHREIEVLEALKVDNDAVIRGLVSEIDEAVGDGEWSHNPDDEPEEALWERVHYLSNEYEVLVEEEDAEAETDDGELLGIIQMIEDLIIEAVEWKYDKGELPWEALRERVAYLVSEYEAAVSDDEDDDEYE